MLPRDIAASTSIDMVAAFIEAAYESIGATPREVSRVNARERAALKRRSEPFRGGQATSSAIVTPPAGVRTPGVLMYGEVPPDQALRVLEQAEPKAGDILVDLGSGKGQVVLSAWQRWGSLLKECRGIEALPGMVDLSYQAAERLPSIVSTETCVADPHGKSRPAQCSLHFAAADFIQQDALWLDADLVFCCSTCMPPEWFTGNGALTRRFSKFKVGARVCVLSHVITGVPGLQPMASVRDLKVSWGSCIARIYVRRDESDESD